MAQPLTIEVVSDEPDIETITSLSDGTPVTDKVKELEIGNTVFEKKIVLTKYCCILKARVVVEKVGLDIKIVKSEPDEAFEDEIIEVLHPQAKTADGFTYKIFMGNFRAGEEQEVLITMKHSYTRIYSSTNDKPQSPPSLPHLSFGVEFSDPTERVPVNN